MLGRIATFVGELLAQLSRCTLEASESWEPRLGVWQRVPLRPSFLSRAGEPRPFHPRSRSHALLSRFPRSLSSDLDCPPLRLGRREGLEERSRTRSGLRVFPDPGSPYSSVRSLGDEIRPEGGSDFLYCELCWRLLDLPAQPRRSSPPWLPGLPWRAFAGAREDSSGKTHPAGGVTWAWLPPLPDPLFYTPHPPEKSRM